MEETLKVQLEKVRKEIRLENEDLAFWTTDKREEFLKEIKEIEPASKLSSHQGPSAWRTILGTAGKTSNSTTQRIPSSSLRDQGV